MATYYVDSAAGGANNGTSWVNAWVSIDSFLSLPPANSDVCLVDDGHSEDLGASKNYAIVTAPETPFLIICVDKADDSKSTGAVIDNGGVGNAWETKIGGSFYCYGIEWKTGAHFWPATGSGQRQVFEKCILDIGNNDTVADVILGDGTAKNAEIIFIDCVVILGTGGASFMSLSGAKTFMRGGSVTKASAAFAALRVGAVDGPWFELEGVDLSGVARAAVFYITGLTGISMGKMIAKSCKVPSGTVAGLGAAIVPPHRFEIMHCESGTPADPSYEMQVMDYWGTTKASAARYRSEGASDKVRSNPYSWEMVATAKALEIYCPHESPPIAGWTDGDGTKEFTYTIYFASDATMQDDEFWAELSVPNDDNTSSQVKILSSRLDPQSTPANITADGDSTWNGAGVGTLQKLVFTHTPDKPGPIEARLFLAKASDTVYIDPKIYITRGGKPDMAAQGRAAIVPGYGAAQEGEARMLVGPGMGGGLK